MGYVQSLNFIAAFALLHCGTASSAGAGIGTAGAGSGGSGIVAGGDDEAAAYALLVRLMHLVRVPLAAHPSPRSTRPMPCHATAP